MLVASTGFLDYTVRLWDLHSGATVQIISLEQPPVAVAFSPDGSRLLAGDINGQVSVYRLTSQAAAVPVEASTRYMNAKVVLVGESGVGKSGLAHRLIDDKFVITYGNYPLPSRSTDVCVAYN